MDKKIIKEYFNWFYEKIHKGENFSVLFEILYLAIMEYFEINEIKLKDDSYVVSEIVGIIYKIACGEKITFSYFYRILTRLKANMIHHNKIINFNTYEDGKLYKNKTFGEIK